MKKEAFAFYRELYAPMVKRIIDNNAAFYGFSETIKWSFIDGDDISVVANCNRKTNIISININSLIKAGADNDFYMVEYFILHEIRHIFQHLVIQDYENGVEVPIDKEIVEKWIFEGSNYIKAIDDNGNEDPRYSLQDCEFDAYAFSYAVMKYKYGDVGLYFPPNYANDFYNLVDDWIAYFKKENIKNIHI